LLDKQDYHDSESFLEFEVNINGVCTVFQVHDNEVGYNKYRFEVRTSDIESYQVTCFHLNKLGFFDDEKDIIDIEQIVKVSGQESKERNQEIMEVACNLLDEEGLLYHNKNGKPIWHIGTFNMNENKWMYGQNTEGFLKSFLKVAIIMAHARQNRNFSLTDTYDDEKDDVTDESPSQYVNKGDKFIDPEEFKELREEWERIGLVGEEYLLEHEKERLSSNGRRDLADKVRHTSLENSAAGYDILSFELDGRQKFIECKTTKGTGNTFELSKNEWETARKYREQYYLYQVKQIEHKPNIKIIQDPFGKFEEGSIDLVPTSYMVKLL